MKFGKQFMPIQILWVWVTCILTIVMTAFTWFIWTWIVTALIDTIETSLGLPPEATTTIAFLRLIFMILPILVTFGLLLWAYVNSQRREDVTYPYY